MSPSDQDDQVTLQNDLNLGDYQHTGIINPESLTRLDDRTEGHGEAARKRAAHYAIIVFFSMAGCLIRLGLDALGAYDGQIIFELAWAQGVGCAIMGLALHKKDEITKIYPPLYTAITTGLAGSVTSFSAWMLGGYQSFANSSAHNRGGFYDTVDGVAYTFSTLAIALGCLYFGEHVSRCLPSLTSSTHRQHQILTKGDSDKFPSKSAKPPKSTIYYLHPRTIMILDYLVFTSAIVSYLIALLLYFLAPQSWRHRATFSILLAPPGAILRFVLANLNTLSPFSGRFPIGTFIANIGGSLLMGGVFAAEYLPSSQGNNIRCNALWAIQQGFCGCLTTVSTFIVEARSIKGKKWTWIYIGGSVVLGHLAILVTFGVAKWAGRLGGSICSV